MRNLFRSMLTFCVMFVLAIATVLFAPPVRAEREGRAPVAHRALHERHGPQGLRYAQSTNVLARGCSTYAAGRANLY